MMVDDDDLVEDTYLTRVARDYARKKGAQVTDWTPVEPEWRLDELEDRWERTYRLYSKSRHQVYILRVPLADVVPEEHVPRVRAWVAQVMGVPVAHVPFPPAERGVSVTTTVPVSAFSPYGVRTQEPLGGRPTEAGTPAAPEKTRLIDLLLVRARNFQ